MWMDLGINPDEYEDVEVVRSLEEARKYKDINNY